MVQQGESPGCGRCRCILYTFVCGIPPPVDAIGLYKVEQGEIQVFRVFFSVFFFKFLPLLPHHLSFDWVLQSFGGGDVWSLSILKAGDPKWMQVQNTDCTSVHVPRYPAARYKLQHVQAERLQQPVLQPQRDRTQQKLPDRQQIQGEGRHGGTQQQVCPAD